MYKHEYEHEHNHKHRTLNQQRHTDPTTIV